MSYGIGIGDLVSLSGPTIDATPKNDRRSTNVDLELQFGRNICHGSHTVASSFVAYIRVRTLTTPLSQSSSQNVDD